MKRAAAALGWDGARCPVRGLPAKARAFLGPVTSPARLASLLRTETELELRICWLPRLRGGSATLVPPFPAPDGKRVAFRLVKIRRAGDILCTTYRREAPASRSTVI